MEMDIVNFYSEDLSKDCNLILFIFFIDADYSNQCKSFYECVWADTSYERIFTFDCPSPLIFDKNKNICNWASSVTCQQ